MLKEQKLKKRSVGGALGHRQQVSVEKGLLHSNNQQIQRKNRLLWSQNLEELMERGSPDWVSGKIPTSLGRANKACTEVQGAWGGARSTLLQLGSVGMPWSLEPPAFVFCGHHDIVFIWSGAFAIYAGKQALRTMFHSEQKTREVVSLQSVSCKQICDFANPRWRKQNGSPFRVRDDHQLAPSCLQFQPKLWYPFCD